MSVCACEGERERDLLGALCRVAFCVCVCVRERESAFVCVCAREREREREYLAPCVI